MAREMKESSVSWIGNIPTSWEIHRMKSCIEDRTSGAWGDEPTGGDGDIICLRIADFDYSKLRFKDCSNGELTIRNYDKTTIERLKLRKGDILIEKSGGGEKTPVGRTVIFDKDYPALYANFMDRLRCSDFVTSQWMQYLLVVFYKNDYSRNYIKQTTGIQNIDLTSMLANEKVPIPSLLEQNRITSFLDTQCAHIYSVVEKTRAAIEEYKRLKQSVITQAVTKGIRPNREMKDSGIEWIGKIPAEWRLSKIKVGVTKVGSGKTPSGGADVYSDKGVLFLRSQNIYDTGLILNPPTYITSEIHEEMKNTRVVPNDVLLNITGGSIGRCCIFLSEFAEANVNQHVSIIRVIKDIIIPEFMHLYWISYLGKMSIQLYQTGGNREGMTAEAIKNSPIPIPSIPEQSEIVAYLDEKTTSIDSIIEKKEQLISELESYKKSLIYEYVTGKKEVI